MINIIKNIFKSKINIVLIIFLFLFLILFIFIKLNYYPVLMIDNNLILNKKIILNTKAVLTFYNNYKKFEESQNFKNEIKNINYEDAELIVINELIDRVFIRQELKKRLGKDLSILVNDKINLYLNSQLEDIGRFIYNLNKDDFINEILIPQAERDILAGRLFLENKNIDDWLKEARKNSKVVIFDFNFKWDGEKVVLNKWLIIN